VCSSYIQSSGIGENKPRARPLSYSFFGCVEEAYAEKTPLMPSEMQVNRNGKRHPQDGKVPVIDTRHTDLAREEAANVRKLEKEQERKRGLLSGSSTSGSDSGAGASGDEDDDALMATPDDGCTSEDSAVSVSYCWTRKKKKKRRIRYRVVPVIDIEFFVETTKPIWRMQGQKTLPSVCLV
jgi:hypothetical protein